MAYTKKTWTNGELLDATKMNHIEDGIYNNSVVQASVSNGTATFANAEGETVFTLDLPLYEGGVE